MNALFSLAASAVQHLTGATVGSFWSKAALILSESADAASGATAAGTAADATSGATAAATAVSPFLNAIEYTIVVPLLYFSVLFCIVGIIWRLFKILGAGLVGVGVTVPLLYFLFRRFRTPVRELSVPADYLLLILILFLFLFGDLMSWGNSWTPNGFVMTKQDFSLYFQGLAQFTFADPRAVLPGSHYHFLVIHVLLADLFFIILPFSKILHAFLSYPINLLRRK